MNPRDDLGPSQGVLDERVDIQALLRTVLRRRWVALGAFGLAIVAVGLYLVRAPRVYKAEVQVVIDRAAPAVLGDVRGVVDLGTSAYWDAQEYYETQYNIVRSRRVAELAAAHLGLVASSLEEQVRSAGEIPLEGKIARDPMFGLESAVQEKLMMLGLGRESSRDELLEKFKKLDPAQQIQGRVEVEPVKDSRLVKIGIEDVNPQRAALIANAVADAYIEYNLDQKVAATRSAVDWLSDQLRELKEKLQISEVALYDFKKEGNIVSVSMEDRQTMISQTLSQLNQSLSTVKSVRLAIESKRARVLRAQKDDHVAGTLDAVIGNQLVQDLKATFSILKQEEAELALKYTEDHPKSLAVRDKLQLVRGDIDREIGRILQGLDANYEEALDNERRLSKAIDEVKQEALEINKKEIDYNRLRRERDNNVALYDLVLKRQKEADLTQLLKVNNVYKLEAALPPGSPIKPKVQQSLLLALVLGLAGGIGLAFLVDFLDNSIKGQEQVEKRLNLPFLGILPIITADKGQNFTEPRERDHYIVAHPHSSVAECARTVRTNLLFMSPDAPARLLLVTSSSPREGKSTTVVNLAITMAQSGARVMVVDTDMRRPRLHKSFGLDNERGVSSVILGDASWSEVVRPGGMEGLDIITCGPIPPNPAELLHTDRFKALLKDLAGHYDRVLFDSPPVAAVTDALVLSSMMDGVILVVQAGKTSLQAAQQAKKSLLDVGAKVFGVVLNDVDLEHKQYGGYYRQYYYYRSGYGYGDEPKKKAV